MNKNLKNNTIRNIRFIFLAVIIFCKLNGFAQPDTVYVSTGEILYGEIQSLDRNVLEFDTKYADSDFEIDWDEVTGISTSTVLTIFTKNGSRLNGTVRHDPSHKRIVKIDTGKGLTEMSLDDVVWFVTHERNFLMRLTISIDAGYSFTKSSEIHQFSSSGKISYNDKSWYWGADFNRIGTYSKDSVPITRSEGSSNFLYNLSRIIFSLVGIEYLENSSQFLNLRFTSKVAGGYYFLRTREMFFYVGLGVANNHEDYGGDSPVKENSFEGMGLLEFDAFNFGDLSLRTQLAAYPGFNNNGRFRLNGAVTLKYDLPLDFYIKFSYTHNFDSKPLIDIPLNDFVIQTNIGWEWN